MMALKLASLAQGASGVRPRPSRMLEAMLAKGLMPVVPCQGSVGASGDLAPLAHMAAAMIGVGEIDAPDGRQPAAQALQQRGLAPLALGPKEGLALLNGTQFSTAYALAALFAADSLLRTALVTGVLSTEAAKGSDAPFDARIHALRRHRGQIDCADALRRADGRQRHPRLASRRRRPRAGPLLPALPAAGDGRGARHCCATWPSVLADEANGVSDNPLIFAEDGDRAFRRQLPRRARRLRRRHDGAGDLRDRLAGRAAHRHAGRSGAVAAAGVPDAASRASTPGS